MANRNARKGTLRKVLLHIRRYRALTVLSLLCALLSSGATLAVPVIIGRAIDSLAGAGRVDFAALGVRLVQIAALVAVAASLQWVMNALNNRITRQTMLINEMKNTSDGAPSHAGRLAGIVQYQTLSNEDGSTSSVQTYEVKAGDTLSRIAEIAYGDASKWPRIKKANPDKIKDDRVRPGDVLIIP